MQPISFSSRDGLTIHGYLTLPKGVAAENLPTVLVVHGGPWARDTWGYDPEVQFLANRGFAVLQINYRGSTGYGKQFLNAGNREWGGKMLDDLIDGADWIVRQGIADKNRLGIYVKLRGYATLCALAFRLKVWPSRLTTWVHPTCPSSYNTIPPYWETFAN
jgi:dipeptidyl aminopeptidase/acylaminoacyl peptidase